MAKDPLVQGARSFVERLTIDQKEFVKKTFVDTRHGSAADKWHKEMAFYRTYGHLAIVPQLHSWKSEAHIIVERRPGIRHIEAVKAGMDQARQRAVSLSYGRAVAPFLQADSGPAGEPSPEVRRHSLQGIGRMGEEALKENTPYRRPGLTAVLDRLAAFEDPVDDWNLPMLTKSDWSSANMLIVGDRVTCIFDFDTAYLSTRLGFVGNIINSCLHLSWTSVRRGLEACGVALPSVEQQVLAAQASMWLKAMPDTQGEIRWPSPTELEQKLADLERKCCEGQRRPL